MSLGHNSRADESEMNVLDVAFNQDQGCFSIAHEHGFLVYNTNPIDLRVRRSFTSSNGAGTGIGLVAMLHRTNYLAMVGGGKNPKFPNNKIIIWDDLKRRPSLNLSFMSSVLNVLLSRIRIVVVLINQVLVYEFSAPPKKVASYETITNVHGLADLSVQSASQLVSPPASYSSLNGHDLSAPRETTKCQILAFPGRTVGQIQLVDVSPEGQEKNSISIIKAHKSNIRFITLNRTGTMVASASETGTIVRIHSTQSTALMYEFRRGLDRAIITSMKFSPNDSKLAVLSDKNTLHVYHVGDPGSHPSSDSYGDGNGQESPSNRSHVLGRFKLPLNYFQSTWSFCSVNTNKYHAETHANIADSAVLGWSGNDTIILVWKQKKIWEKYMIVKTTDNSAAASDHGISNAAPTHTSSYSIVRMSWKSLDS